MKVYEMIQALSEHDADDEVVFATELGLLITSDDGKEIETDVRGEMELKDISYNARTHKITMELRY